MNEAYAQFDALMSARFSCRAFLPKPVPDETIRAIVHAAGKAPSWCNAQPWELEITKGAATDELRRVVADAQAAGAQPQPDFLWPERYSGVYQGRRREVGWQLYNAVGVEKGDRAGAARQSARNFVMFDAPHVAILHSPAQLSDYGAIDCGGFVTAFCLAAQALDVQSIPQAAITPYSPQIRAHLGLSDERRIVCAISFGFGAMDDPANSFRAGRVGENANCRIID